MNIFKTYSDLPKTAQNSVIAIGNFDGLHRGHQALLTQAKKIAREKDLSCGVLTFEPHPRILFQPDTPVSRITPADMKCWRLEQEGMDHVFALPFDWEFASQSYQDFIQNILIDGLSAAHVVIGYNFFFGQLRKGQPKHIQDAGIETTIIDKVEEGGETLSSSRIRQCLRHGSIKQANEILGWDWEIRGEVIKGDQRGREMGYPTANMKLGDTIHPAYGVYAGLVQIEGENKWHQAALNIGIRPMFKIEEAQLEAHIFNFDRDIYGKTLRVKPVKRLRGEAKFETLDELITQIGEDCEEAREVLKS